MTWRHVTSATYLFRVRQRSGAKLWLNVIRCLHFFYFFLFCLVVNCCDKLEIKPNCRWKGFFFSFKTFVSRLCWTFLIFKENWHFVWLGRLILYAPCYLMNFVSCWTIYLFFWVVLRSLSIFYTYWNSFLENLYHLYIVWHNHSVFWAFLIADTVFYKPCSKFVLFRKLRPTFCSPFF